MEVGLSSSSHSAGAVHTPRPQDGAATPAAAVVSLIRGLEQEASTLRCEKEALLSERSRYASIPWAPAGGAPAAAAAAVLSSSSRLPRKCAEKLGDAALQERRATEAKGQVQKAERELRRYIEQRREVEKQGKEAVFAADERRKAAEQKLAQLKALRQQATDEHDLREAGAENEASLELASIEARVEAERQVASWRNRELRKQTAEQSTRVAQEIEALRAEFALRHEDLERSLADHDAACADAVAAAEQRSREADERARFVWRSCQEQLVALHTSVDGQVEQVGRSKSDKVAETNRRLAEMEAALANDLQALVSQEQANNSDHTAETQALATVNKLSEDVRRRRELCEDAVQSCGEELAYLLQSATRAGESAVMRAKAAQETADQEIEALRLEMEEWSRGRYEKKIVELQAQLNGIVATLRGGLCQRLNKFRAEAAQQAVQADKALATADQQVQRMRKELQTQMAKKANDLAERLDATRRARNETQVDVREKVVQAQQQMMKYIESMEQEMLDALRSPDSAELTLTLPLVAQTPVSPLLALADETMTVSAP